MGTDEDDSFAAFASVFRAVVCVSVCVCVCFVGVLRISLQRHLAIDSPDQHGRRPEQSGELLRVTSLKV